MNGWARPALIRPKLFVPDSLAPVACLVMALSSLDRLRWSLFFIFNLRRIVFFLSELCFPCSR